MVARRLKRGFTSMAALAIGAGLLAACGSGSEDPGPVSSDGELRGTVTFQTWALKPKFTDYVEGVIADFEKENPEVTVEWLDQPGDGYDQKVLTQAASGDLPDVTNLPPDFALPLAQNGVLANIDEIDPDAAADFVPGGLEGYQYDGIEGTYGYPWYLGTDVNYWNTKLLEANGVDPKALPTDLDSLIETARTFQKSAGDQVHLISALPGVNAFQNAGVDMFNEDGTELAFNTEPAAELVQKYVDAYEEGLLPDNILTDTFQGNSALYNEQKVAWTTGGGNHISSTLANDAPTLVDVTVPSPAFDTPPLYVQGLSVKKDSENIDAAVALARFVTNAENQKAFAELVPGIFPSTVESAEDPFFSESDGTNAGDAMVIAFEGLKTAVPNNPRFSGAMDTILKQQIALALSGEISAQEALDKAVEEGNQLIQ